MSVAYTVRYAANKLIQAHQVKFLFQHIIK